MPLAPLLHPDRSPFRERLSRVHGDREMWGGRLPVIVLVLGSVLCGVNLLLHSVGVWFWADDWDLLFLRGNIPQYNQGLLAPHNNHWLSAQIVIYKLIFAVFGMRSYTPYAFVEISMHLGIVLLIYLVLRRVGAGRWVPVLAALMVAFYGLGANAEIYAASMNHVGALLFGLLAALWTVTPTLDERRMRLRTSLALMVSLTFGLTSLAMLVLLGILLLSRHGWLNAVRVLGPPAATFAVWWLVYGHVRAVNSVSPSLGDVNLAKVPSFVWTGLTGTLGDGSGLTGAGPLLALVLAAGLVLARNQPLALVQLAWAGVLADLFQLTIVSVARFNFGANQLGTSHYSYINIVLLTPAVALIGTILADWTGQPRWRTALVAAAVFVAYAVNGLTYVQQWQKEFTFVSGGGEDLALAMASGVARGQKVLTDKNPDPFNALLSPKYVGAPEIRRALPHRSPSPRSQIAADSEFFTGVGEKSYGLARPFGVTPYSGFTPTTFKPGCQRRTSTVPEPIISIRTGVVGNEIVVWSSSTVIKTRLQRGDITGPLMSWKAQPGPMHIATSAKNVNMTVSFNGAGSYTVCIA
jgi:hypothetical protein